MRLVEIVVEGPNFRRTGFLADCRKKVRNLKDPGLLLVKNDLQLCHLCYREKKMGICQGLFINLTLKSRQIAVCQIHSTYFHNNLK